MNSEETKCQLKKVRAEYNRLIERKIAGTIETKEFSALEHKLNIESSRLKRELGIFTEWSIGAVRCKECGRLFREGHSDGMDLKSCREHSRRK